MTSQEDRLDRFDILFCSFDFGDDTEALDPFDLLRDRLFADTVSNDTHYLPNIDTITRERQIIRTDTDLRLPQLGFDFGTLQPLYAGKCLIDLSGDIAHDLLVFTIDLDGKFCLDPFEQLFNAHRDGLCRDELDIVELLFQRPGHLFRKCLDIVNIGLEGQQNFHIVALSSLSLFTASNH